MSSALEVRDLSLERGGKSVLRDVSLTVERGKIVALLGANGAGKSSLVLGVAGAIPISAGQVLSEGVDLSGLASYKVREAGIAAVPEGHRVLAGLNVQENLEASGAYLDVKAMRQGVDFAYDVFPELAERKEQRAGSMSGGQQQMLALAQALVGQPKVILADEMSLGLAPLVVKRLLEVTKRLANEGVGVLLIEQFTHLALGVAETAVVLERGKAVFSGASSDLADNPEILHEAYLSAG